MVLILILVLMVLFSLFVAFIAFFRIICTKSCFAIMTSIAKLTIGVGGKGYLC